MASNGIFRTRSFVVLGSEDVSSSSDAELRLVDVVVDLLEFENFK